jgi:ribosomal protein L22
MSGRFPKKAAEHFIVLLKSLQANAIQNEVEDPIITKAISNLGSRPLGRFGAVKRKRTNIKLVCRERKITKQKGDKK